MKIALCLFGYVGSTSTKTNACALTDNFEYICIYTQLSKRGRK